MGLYLCTHDMDATVAAIQALGGTLAFGPHDVADLGTMLGAVDATGAYFGVWRPGAHSGTRVVNEPGGYAWAEVNTWKQDDTVAFYTGLFAFGRRDGMEGYAMLTVGDEPVAGVMQMTEQWAGMPSHWMVYFAVADIGEAASQVVALGGQVRHGPFETPYGPIVVAADPTGAAFSLVQLRA